MRLDLSRAAILFVGDCLSTAVGSDVLLRRGGLNLPTIDRRSQELPRSRFVNERVSFDDESDL